MKQIKEQVPVIPSKDIFVGTAKAPVTFTLFGDYESEGTARATEVIADLLEQYEGQLKFVFRHFPLTRIHQKAHKAAEAVIGASQEGKFWEMHRLLLQHRSNLGVISLKGYAREVGVTNKRFLENLMNSDWGWFVQDDLKDGLKLGVSEVPTLFINNERFTKELSPRNLKSAIDEVLKSKSKVVGLKERKRA